MKILFVGTPKVAADTLRQLLTDEALSGLEIAAVLTREDAPIGRKRVLTPSEVASTAEQLGVPVIKANRVDESVLDKIRAHKIDAAVVVAYGSLIGTTALEALPLGWFNLHYSRLPNYRGAAPVQWALINGDHETGVTLFKLDQGMDTGPILGYAGCVIEPNDNSSTLLEKLRLLGVSLLSEHLPKIEAGIANLSDQPKDGVSSAPKLNRNDGLIDWSQSSRRISNLIRGTNPEPGAFTSFHGSTLKVLEAREIDVSISAESFQAPSQIGTFTKSRNSVVVRTGAGCVELIRVQPAGKSPMSAESWFAGLANKFNQDELAFEEWALG